jgi:tetratricopeptide (TPR) repeat protein
MPTNSVRLIASAVLAALPLAALAQTSVAYTPPKLVKPGTSTTALAGPGSVTVQVFVKKDGTFRVVRVISSTNAGDNAAALEIAKTATYKPAARDGQPADGFYDYTLNLGGAVALTSTTAGGGPTARAYGLIRDGKYADAVTALQSYLQTHPGDVQASTLLGVANAFGGNDDAAARAFDAVPSVPAQYHTLALQAYSKAASNALDTQRYSDLTDATNHMIALDPTSVDGYFLRGIANANQQKYSDAMPDLLKALDLAKSSKVDDKSMANIEFSLAVAQLNTGAFEAAAATGKDVVRLDPLQKTKLQQAEFVAVSNAAVAQANAGKAADAVTTFETGATLFPAGAADLYGQAAFVLLSAKVPDYKKLKVEVDRALAIDPTNGRALFASAFVAANGNNDMKTAVADMNKAKASPLYGADASFAKQVDDNLKKLTASGS